MFFLFVLLFFLYMSFLFVFPADARSKLNVHKTFRRRSGRLQNVLYTFNLCPVSTGLIFLLDMLFLFVLLFFFYVILVCLIIFLLSVILVCLIIFLLSVILVRVIFLLYIFIPIRFIIFCFIFYSCLSYFCFMLFLFV